MMIIFAGLGVSAEALEKFRKNFEADPKNQLAQNVCTTHPLRDVCKNRTVLQNTQHCFSHKVTNSRSKYNVQRIKSFENEL